MADATERLIQAAVEKFTIQRGSKFISTGHRSMRIGVAREERMMLPDGTVVRVTIDDSGTVSQIEEEDGLHAIARPRTFVGKMTSDAPGVRKG